MEELGMKLLSLGVPLWFVLLLLMASGATCTFVTYSIMARPVRSIWGVPPTIRTPTPGNIKPGWWRE